MNETDPLPADFPAGWQEISHKPTLIVSGDILVSDSTDARQPIRKKEWAWGLRGSVVEVANGCGFTVYRRLAVAKQGDSNRSEWERASTPAPVQASTLPDSGARTSFGTGAVRDAMVGKGFPHMIPPVAIRKIARRFEDGALKYGRNNWQKGIPLSRYQDAIWRHTLAWAEGMTDEDHLGAVGWNMAAAAWTEQEIAAGRLPAALDDLPFRAQLTAAIA